jgi:non-specific protein-tyrosine kinase
MELRTYIEILWRRKWIIIITILLTEIIVIIGSFMIKPVYSASTKIRIAAAASTGSLSYSDSTYADRLMNTYIELATTTPVFDNLKQQLGLNILPTIKVDTIPNTELIQIIVEDQNPALAANVANTLADILIDQSLQLYSGTGRSSSEILNTQVLVMEQQVNEARINYLYLLANDPTNTDGIQTAKQKLDIEQQMYNSLLDQYEQTRLNEAIRQNSISVVEPAAPPMIPSKPNKALNIALGFFVGMVGGLGLAFLFENLDTTIHTTNQIKSITDLPIIGEVPELDRNNLYNLVDSNLAAGEAFRRLRTNILSADFPIRSLMITSADPKEGKSSIIANLAYTMAQSGLKVIVVDADMRVPSQHVLFNIDNKIGLSSILEQNARFPQAIRSSKFEGVHVIPSGPLPVNPSELLGSDQMKKIIDQISKVFDIAIIDAPAALAVTDATVLASMVDAIALVICRGKTRSQSVKSVQAQFDKIKIKWLGVIFNRSEMNRSNYYYARKKRNEK